MPKFVVTADRYRRKVKAKDGTVTATRYRKGDLVEMPEAEAQRLLDSGDLMKESDYKQDQEVKAEQERALREAAQAALISDPDAPVPSSESDNYAGAAASGTTADEGLGGSPAVPGEDLTEGDGSKDSTAPEE